MNLRIDEIAKDCWEYYPGTLDGNIREFDYKKFAQLIVKECLVQVNEVYTTLDNSDEQVGVARVGLTIAAHFGVEE